jgi:hypothetical protein
VDSIGVGRVRIGYNLLVILVPLLGHSPRMPFCYLPLSQWIMEEGAVAGQS